MLKLKIGKYYKRIRGHTLVGHHGGPAWGWGGRSFLFRCCLSTKPADHWNGPLRSNNACGFSAWQLPLSPHPLFFWSRFKRHSHYPLIRDGRRRGRGQPEERPVEKQAAKYVLCWRHPARPALHLYPPPSLSIPLSLSPSRRASRSAALSII